MSPDSGRSYSCPPPEKCFGICLCAGLEERRRSACSNENAAVSDLRCPDRLLCDEISVTPLPPQRRFNFDVIASTNSSLYRDLQTLLSRLVSSRIVVLRDEAIRCIPENPASIALLVRGPSLDRDSSTTVEVAERPTATETTDSRRDDCDVAVRLASAAAARLASRVLNSSPICAVRPAAGRPSGARARSRSTRAWSPKSTTPCHL